MRLPGSTGFRGRGGRGILSFWRACSGVAREPVAGFAGAQVVEEFAGGGLMGIMAQGSAQVVEGGGTFTASQVYQGQVERDNRRIGAQFPGSLEISKRSGITLHAVVEHAAIQGGDCQGGIELQGLVVVSQR